ncbi:MAG: hypothetical protein WCF81_20200 [Roseiarcus sp.]
MAKRSGDWPSFWRERAAPHDKDVECFIKNFAAGQQEVGKLEAVASFQDKFDENRDLKRSEGSNSKRVAIHYSYYTSETVNALCEAAQLHWKSGDFVGFCLIGRLIFEYAAAIHYVLKSIRHGKATNDWREASSNLSTLLIGTRRPFWYEWLPTNQELPKSINVLTMIKHWIEQNPSSEDDYAFLSEACHPNFQLTITCIKLVRRVTSACLWSLTAS